MSEIGNRPARRARLPHVETSAGGVIYRWRNEIPHILLIRDGYAHWGLPKGHLESGETPDAAALREAREETGLGDLVLGPRLQTIDWYFRDRGRLVHKFCHFFLVTSHEGDAVPQLDEGITACQWLPLEQAVAQVTYANAREVIRIAGERLGLKLSA